MVKIPSLDDLKKAGAGFVDQAKAGGFSGMVDKLKTGIDNVAAARGGAPIPPGDDALRDQIKVVLDALSEVTQAQAVQAAAVSKVEIQLAVLSRAIDAAAMEKQNKIINEEPNQETKK